MYNRFNHQWSDKNIDNFPTYEECRTAFREVEAIPKTINLTGARIFPNSDRAEEDIVSKNSSYALMDFLVVAEDRRHHDGTGRIIVRTRIHSGTQRWELKASDCLLLGQESLQTDKLPSTIVMSDACDPLRLSCE